MNDSQQKKSAIIAGMAPGFGAAIAKTLIADGYNCPPSAPMAQI